MEAEKKAKIEAHARAIAALLYEEAGPRECKDASWNRERQ